MAKTVRALIDFLLLSNWQRKLTAVLLATIVWFLVDYSATMQRRFDSVPVYVKNLTPNHTVKGMRSGTRLPFTTSLTVRGKRAWIKDIRSNDLKVVLDAKDKRNKWAPKITAQHIYSVATRQNLANSISEVSSSPLNIEIEPTVEIPLTVYVAKPMGVPPQGYQFVGISPRKLRTTVRVSAEEAEHFRSTNAQIEIDLNRISAEKLNKLAHKAQAEGSEIISFEIPDSWKKFTLPDGSDKQEILAAAASKRMQINFIKEKLLPLKRKIPISIFLPPRISSHLSAELVRLNVGKNVVLESGVHVLNLELYAGGVTPEFLDTVRDFLQISVIFDQADTNDSKLRWSLEFINERKLEKWFLKKAIENYGFSESDAPRLVEQFRTFCSQMRLYTGPGKRLNLEINQDGHAIDIRNISHARKVTTLE